MNNQEIYDLWTEFVNEYEKYLLSNKEIWLNTLKNVKKYIDDNNKSPSDQDININIKVMGTWISTQKKNYNKKQNIMKNQEIYDIWAEFVNEYKKNLLSNKENWLNTLENVEKYIDNNNKLPSTHDKNNDIKVMGSWISTQKKNYDKKQYIMKNQEIYDVWTEFVNEYEKYFIK